MRKLTYLFAFVFLIALVNAYTFWGVPNSGIISAYNFNEMSGTTAEDASNRDYDLICNNCEGDEWGEGKVSGAIELNFTLDNTEYFSTTSNADFNMTESISMWFINYDISGAAGTKTLITKSADFRGALSYEDNQKSIVYYYANGTPVSVARTGNLGSNQWYHVVLTMDGTNRTIYIDGEQNASGTDSTSTPWQTVNNVSVGGIGTRTIHGRIDALQLWNKTLNLTEIADLYNAGDGLEPSLITLNAPSNGTRTVNKTIIFNATSESVFGNALVNATLYLDGVANGTETLSGTSQTYTFERTLAFGTYVWSIGVYDNQSNFEMSENRSLNISAIVENSQTFNDNVLAESNQDFLLNVSSSEAITSALFIYNDTGYSASIVDGGAYYNVTYDNFEAPSATVTTNFSFYWNITTSLGTTQLDSRNQTVNVIAVDDCSVYTNVLYNFTLLDEIDQTKLSSTSSNIDLDVYTSGTSNLIGEYSGNSTSNPFAVCIDNNLDDDVEIDAHITYSATGYAQENYYIEDDLVTNSSQHERITLYDLDNDSSTTFNLVYKDSNFLPVENAIIQIQRKYLSEGVFKTVEQPKTDRDGETIAHLQTEDAVYTFIVVVDGAVDATFDNVIAYCPNPLLEDCEIRLTNFESSINFENFGTVNGVSFTIGYDDETREVSSIFTVLSGSAEEMQMNVSLFDRFGNTSVCFDTLTSSSGTLACTVPNSFGNASVVVNLYKDGEKVGNSLVKISQRPDEVYGASLVFVALIAIMLLIGMGATGEPMIQGFFLILGTILLVAMNIMFSTGWIGAGATFMWFIIAVIMVLIKGGGR